MRRSLCMVLIVPPLELTFRVELRASNITFITMHDFVMTYTNKCSLIDNSLTTYRRCGIYGITIDNS